MITKIYINHSIKEVETEIEMNKMIEDRIEGYLKEETFFSEWLEETFYPIDIWNMTEDERQNAKKDFKAYTHDYVIREFEDDGWKEYTLNL